MTSSGSSQSDEYTPPTDDQLVNFVTVLTVGPAASSAQKDLVRSFLAVGPFRDEWLARHRQMQDAARAL